MEDTEDLAQKVFLQAWRGLGRYRQAAGPFRSWLLTIAHNVTVSFFRSQKRAEQLLCEPADTDGGIGVDEKLEDQYEWSRIREAIRQLKPDQQQVITMRFLENVGYQEISAAMGKSEGNVRVIQHRALQRLRELLAREAH